MSSYNVPWIEKYRPQELEDVVFADAKNLTIFKDMVSSKQVPHLLFSGSAGTGKTTTAKILAKSITQDVLYINASDENDVNTIRNKVKEFCSVIGWEDIRVVLLDECDHMSQSAQAALRNIMEEYIKYARFILTANFPNKILDALISRCQHFEFTGAPKKAILKRLVFILKTEGVKVKSMDQLVAYVNGHGSDIRGLIGNIQKNVVNGELQDFSSLMTDISKYIELVQAQNFSAFSNEFMTDNIDPAEMLRMIFNEADKINEEHKTEIRLACGEGLRWHANVVDPQINMFTSVLEIMTLF